MNGGDTTSGSCQNRVMATDPTVRLRSAMPGDEAFIVEMARHACGGVRLGAVWTFHNDPPLCVTAGVAVPELCIGVAPGRRGSGIGGLLLDELFVRLRGSIGAVCANVHVRNPAQNLYQRKGFRTAGQGRGPLGVVMVKDLWVRQ